jgi:hypothetical protein
MYTILYIYIYIYIQIYYKYVYIYTNIYIYIQIYTYIYKYIINTKTLYLCHHQSEGAWLEDLKHGQGKRILPGDDGVEILGFWENGELVEKY